MKTERDRHKLTHAQREALLLLDARDEALVSTVVRPGTISSRVSRPLEARGLITVERRRNGSAVRFCAKLTPKGAAIHAEVLADRAARVASEAQS